MIIAPNSPAIGATAVKFHFENHVLDAERRELRRDAELVALEPQVFDLLLYLVKNRERVVSKDDLIAAVWSGRVVSDSTLDSRINAARKAVGDDGKAQRLIRTSARKGLRFVAQVREVNDREDTPLVPALVEKQEISFCRSSDNINIAFAEVGAGAPLLKTANWLTHLEYDWESPLWSPLLHWLAARARLVRYDSRGNGLSDQSAEEISFAGFVRDFECVAKTTKFDRFAILGISQGAAIAIDYAARHPERVSKLVLLGGYAQGRNMRESEAEKEKARIFLSMMRQGWGDEHSAFMRAFASIFIPNGSPEQIKWFADLQRNTTTAQNAVRIRNACDAIDVVSSLPKVKVPTLVLHCRHDNVVPLEQGRLMATSIPNARFVTLESENHVLIPNEPAWPRFLNEIEAFLAE